MMTVQLLQKPWLNELFPANCLLILIVQNIHEDSRWHVLSMHILHHNQQSYFPVWCGRLKIPWVGKGSAFLLLISYIISSPWYNWNIVAMVSKNNKQGLQIHNTHIYYTTTVSIYILTGMDTIIHKPVIPILICLSLHLNLLYTCSYANIYIYDANTHAYSCIQ